MIELLLMTLEAEERNRVLALWQDHGPSLVRYAQKELGPMSDDAEDVVSDAFERLMLHYERYGDRTDEQIKGLFPKV